MKTRIAIVGGGIGGLTLARVLHVHGFDDTLVFERDTSPTARSQGGSLDLHPESGQHALAIAGLTEEFWAIARPEGETLRIVDPAGTTLVNRRAANGGSRPEVDRSALRQILVTSLAADTIIWDARVLAVEPRPEGGVRLRLQNGSIAACDLVVGADGAHSLMRTLLTDQRATYLSTYVFLTIEHIDRTHPELAALVGPGTLWGVGVNQNLAAQREGSGRVRVAASFRATEDWQMATQLQAAVPARAKQLLRDLFRGWSPRLTAFIDAADDEVVVRVLHTTPVGLRWAHRPGLTLIGDAAHLMPPVGEGANHAMLDGAQLGLALTGLPNDLDAAVHAFEQRMFERIEPVAQDSAEMAAMILSPTAAADLTRFFTPRQAAAQ